MTKKPVETPKPTSAELEILTVLWDLGPATVRQVFDAINHRRTTGYTTILKLMQIMAEKGLVERDQAARAHVYRAAVNRIEAEDQLVDDLLDRAFGGSAAALVMRALSGRKTSKREIAEIRKMLDEAGGGR